jgi:hypothetical protein
MATAAIARTSPISGHARGDARGQHGDGDNAETHGQRSRARFGQVAQEVQQASRRPARRVRHAQDHRQLADNDMHRDAGQQPGDHRT